MDRSRRHARRYPQNQEQNLRLQQNQQQDQPQRPTEMNDRNQRTTKRRPLFNGTNWTSFKFSVTIDLHDEDVFNVATGVTERPQGNAAPALE